MSKKHVVIGSGALPDEDRRAEELNREPWEITAARLAAAFLNLNEALNAKDLDQDPDIAPSVVEMRALAFSVMNRQRMRAGEIVITNME